ncbi:MAG: universal stress protein, partial [Bacteroidota bacterium]
MKKILVPTDFKESADNALDAALQISAASDQEVLILLLNIIDPERFYKVNESGEFIDASTDEEYRKHLVHQSGLRLEELIEKKGVKNIVGRVETGDTAQIITDYVEKEAVDLLVKGIHRTSIYEEMLFASNSQKIIHSVSCPVLTIRNKVESFTCANMVFATDLKADISSVEPQIKEIQRLFESTIHFVYINTPGNFYNNRRINEMKETYFQQYSFENFEFY